MDIFLPQSFYIIGSTCQNFVGSYKCICALGYTGTNCDVTTDYCLSLPCVNNGLCVLNIANFTYNCICLPGYTGQKHVL
jgi:hypothetical protein